MLDCDSLIDGLDSVVPVGEGGMGRVTGLVIVMT